MKGVGRSLTALVVAMAVSSASAVLLAHEMLFPGIVMAVETERVQVRTTDQASRQEVTIWFTVTEDTQVKRGDRVVAYADAGILKDERIVVVVNHEEPGSETVATELRLAAR